jgi:hypothetical protein
VRECGPLSSTSAHSRGSIPTYSTSGIDQAAARRVLR